VTGREDRLNCCRLGGRNRQNDGGRVMSLGWFTVGRVGFRVESGEA
jgi:hypothetical protein